MMQDWVSRLCGGKTGATEGQPERYPLDVPFSFVCGERSSREWVKPENARRETGKWTNGQRLHLLRWSDQQSALFVTMELTQFADFPAMEWVVRLRYEGAGETEPIRDFNMDPGPYWDAAEEAGRKGWLEIRFVEGLYAFWDELRRRHPHLLIDNCASGGRRLELETVSRSVALWRTDYNCFPYTRAEASQVHTAGLQLWLPLNSTSPAAKPGDTYQARSAYSAGLILSLNEFGISEAKPSDADHEWFRRRLAEIRRLRPYFRGDFHLLTPCVFDLDSWLVYQLILPEKQEGAILAFRRPESPMTSGCFQLRGLDEGGAYAFEDADGGQNLKAGGQELMEKGLVLSIAAPRASRLVFFRRT